MVTMLETPSVQQRNPKAMSACHHSGYKMHGDRIKQLSARAVDHNVPINLSSTVCSVLNS